MELPEGRIEAAQARIMETGERARAETSERLNALAGNPDELALLDEALQRHLHEPITVQSFRAAEDAVEPLLGRAAWVTLSSFAVFETELAEDLDLTPEAAAAVRRLLTLHGPQIRRGAFLAYPGAASPNDWKNVARNLYLDIESGSYHVEVEIHKNDGSISTIDTDPDGLIRLIRSLTMVAAAIGDARAFNEDVLKRYRDSIVRFEQMLRGEPAAGGSPGEPTAPATEE